MSVSISSCPKCKSLLLSDTIQCPTCHHVLKPHKAANMSEFKLHSEVMGSGSDDIPCPDCGEMVRKELVRCWRCGGFLRSEMAETYQRMRDNVQTPTAPVLREIPTPKSSPEPVTSLPPLADDDDDFSLGPGVTAFAPGQAPPALTPVADNDESYSLGPIPAIPKSSVPESPQETPPASPATESAVPSVAGAPAAPSSESAASATPATGEAHSVATAGDVLLDIAKQEEQESEKRRKDRGKRKPSGPAGARAGFIIFCPHGHQIEVQEKNRGQMGKCPRCKAAFIVPLPLVAEKPAEAVVASAEAAVPVEQPGALTAGKFTRWMNDVRVHSLDPTTLKLKPGSLENAFELMDLGFGQDGLLLLNLAKKGSMFGSAAKKKPEIREAVVAHLAAGKPLAELQVAAQRLFAPDMIKQIQVVQPAQYAHESMFAGIPVFGLNRIAARLPKSPEGNELLFASFWLSEFREFAKQMDEVFGVKGLGEDLNLPLTEKYADYKCHYTETTFQALENIDYYQADPNIKLLIVGRKCEGCGLIVSEDGRKKEKLGGPDGKGIAKAKCPKCQKKFGSITLYALETPQSGSPEPAPASTEAAPAEVVPTEAAPAAETTPAS